MLILQDVGLCVCGKLCKLMSVSPVSLSPINPPLLRFPHLPLMSHVSSAGRAPVRGWQRVWRRRQGGRLLCDGCDVPTDRVSDLGALSRSLSVLIYVVSLTYLSSLPTSSSETRPVQRLASVECVVRVESAWLQQCLETEMAQAGAAVIRVRLARQGKYEIDGPPECRNTDPRHDEEETGRRWY